MPIAHTIQDDFNLDLEHFHGQFDMVHGRPLVFGLGSLLSYIHKILAQLDMRHLGTHDYRQLISSIHKILRPGGLVLLCEIQSTMFDASCNPFHPDVR